MRLKCPGSSAQVQPYEKIKAKGLPADISACLSKLAVVKLNGGLGTSMGCKGPKSLISVRNENTFLDLTVQQIEVRLLEPGHCRFLTCGFNSVSFFLSAFKQNVQHGRAAGPHELLQH